MPELDSHIYVERAHSLDELAARVRQIAEELADQGAIVSSISHTVDREDPEGSYQFIVVARSVDS